MWNCTHFRHPTDEQLRHLPLLFFRLLDISSNSNLPSVLFKLNTCLFYALDKKEKKLKHGGKGAATLSTSLECQRGRTNYMHNHTMDKRR